MASSKTHHPASSSSSKTNGDDINIMDFSTQYNTYSSKEQQDAFPAGSIANPEDGVLVMLEDFYYFEDPLTDRVEEWANQQDRAVLESFGQEEHSLVQTALHEEYKALFETILTEFLQSQGFTVQQFYQAAAQEEESMQGKRKNGDTFSAVVMAASDFDEFCEMMNMVRQGHGVAFCPPLEEWSGGEEEEEEEEEDVKEVNDDAPLQAWPATGDVDEGKSSGNRK